jgi:ribosomal protein S16
MILQALLYGFLFNVIRLKRGGHKRLPVYQIVCILKYKRNKGNFLKRLGFLNLTKTEHLLFLDLHSLGSSLNNGAC